MKSCKGLVVLVIIAVGFVIGSLPFAKAQNQPIISGDQDKKTICANWLAKCEAGLEDDYRYKVKQREELIVQYCPGGKYYTNQKFCDELELQTVEIIAEWARTLISGKQRCVKDMQAYCNALAPSPIEDGPPGQVPIADMLENCNRSVGKYFPTAKIESITDNIITGAWGTDKNWEASLDISSPKDELKKEALNWGSCIVNFGDKPGQIVVTLGYYLLPSKGTIKSVLSGGEPLELDSIGDESGYMLIKIPGPPSGAANSQIPNSVTEYLNNLKLYYAAATKGSLLLYISHSGVLSRKQVEELLKTAMGGNAGPTPDSCSQEELTIKSYSPKDTYAGQVSNPQFDSEGYELYTSHELKLDLDGKCLQGIKISSQASQAVGLDGSPAIIVNWAQSNSDGSQAKASIWVTPEAKEGPVELMIENKYGKRQNITLQVLITGTQFLNRSFAESLRKVKFYGSWPTITDNVRKTKTEVENAFVLINKPSYQKLGIYTKIYSSSYWNEVAAVRMCRVSWATGCAPPSNNIIYVADFPEEIRPTILHESVHKLHFCYLGTYLPVPACTINNFNREWMATVGEVLLKVESVGPLGIPIISMGCAYLPMADLDHWRDSSSEPRCGFIQPYGVYDIHINNYTMPSALYEDVATMTEEFVFRKDSFGRGDAVIDPIKLRYDTKLNLLSSYKFY